MSDDPNRRGPPDRSRINPDEEHELRYSIEKFGVSQEALKKAVREVGPMVNDVEEALSKH